MSRKFLWVALLLSLAILPVGCKKPPPPAKPTPSPTNTPIPERDRVGFVQNGQLLTVRPNGTEMAVLFSRKNESVWFPCASRDGSHFLAWISKSDGTQNVARIDARTGAVQYLTSIFAKARPEMKNTRLGNAPAYSPDGTKIAYSFNGDIWIMDADGYNAVTEISDHNSWSPSWSWDGKKLAYVNTHEHHTQLWVTDLDDRDSYQVTDFEDYSVGHPQWNLNDKNILFTKSQKDTCQLAQVLAVGISEPLVDSNPITRDEHSQGGEFSPDGLKIVYASSKDGLEWNVWICSAAGSDNVFLTQKCLAFSPTWLHPKAQAAAASVAAVPTPYKPSYGTTPQAPAPAAASPAAQAQASQAKPATSKPLVTAEPVQAAQPAQPQPVAPEKPSAPAGRQIAGRAQPQAATEPSAAAAPAVPEKPVPTQPPVKMAPLKFHIPVGFDSGAKILSGLPNIKTVAARIKQYRDSDIHIRGPLDSSAVGAKFSSATDRSRARAEAVRKVLAKESGIPESAMAASPYTPPVFGAPAGPSNSLQIYIDLK